MRRTSTIGIIAALGLTHLGCYSGRGEFAADPASEGPEADGGDTASDPLEPDPPQPQCEGAPAPAALRRLTALEYDNTVRDLLGDEGRPALRFSPDEAVAGFDANSVAPLSALQLDEYLHAAETVAADAVRDRWDAVVGCDAAADACVSAFITRFGRRALRRPLEPDEVDEYRDIFEDIAGAYGEEAGVETVISAMLMSPSFLYHAESPPPAGEALAARDDYELASRLSYFLWSSMPDDELLDRAASGELRSRESLEQQARRMLEDERAASTIASFHEQWLHIERTEELVKDPARFPEWSPALAQSMKQETRAFVDEVIRRGDGSLGTLLSASWSVIDSNLAALYGVEGPSSGFAVAELDADERAGLLTHASFLANNAHAGENSWVHRGLFVRERLLCGELPPPPPGVDGNEANDPGRLENPECAACHRQIDPIGQGLDAYSPIGAFRATDEAGNPIDVTGTVEGLPELETFEGGVELAHAMASSPLVGDCVAAQWFRFAHRRREMSTDACDLENVRAAFADSDYDIRELIVAITGSDAFRFVGGS